MSRVHLMKQYNDIKKDLKLQASKEHAISMKRFFKTGKGEYGEGDQFYGVSVPLQRKIAKKYANECHAQTISSLLDSSFHEERLTGVFILVLKFNTAIKSKDEEPWVKLYLEKLDRVNNWDLVDSSAHLILGKWLEDKDRKLLYSLAASSDLWKNRVAIIATLHFIRKNDFKDILRLAKLMLTHQHDLIHKASGWMLREVWQRDTEIAEHFLRIHKKNMPRTMLRYAIEKMPESKRKRFLRVSD
jgi:hypothetical protein